MLKFMHILTIHEQMLVIDEYIRIQEWQQDI